MSTTITTLELIERVVRLELQQAPVEVLATQILGPLFDALGARAGALLCYRRDEGALSLAAGRGLSASGAERLGGLRWGGSGAWGMPLRALAERKAYVVESADLREFSSDLVGPQDAAAAASVIGIPLHRGQQPVGVVLALADHATEPSRILEHALAYDVLALALASALWGGARAATVDVTSAPPPMLVCEAWVDLRVRVLGADSAAMNDGRLADRAVLDAMLQDLRGAVDALRAERRLEEAERTALAERLAAAERDRAEHAARTASLERELGRHETLLAEARTELARASTPRDVADVVSEPAPAAPALPQAVTASALPPAATETPSPAPRVLDFDTARGEEIAAALGRALPIPPARALVVANLFDANAQLLAELTAAALQGAMVVGYVADGTRSRILGGVRCFADPPASGEVTAALEAQPRGGKRVITLSDDIDAFIPAKAELAKMGYSTSMACDDKQAIDLLALLNPDAVLVDLRATPEAAAGFIDALAPESGRILTLLVHGDPARGALRRALERLLRPMALDANDLSRVCRGILANASAASRQTGVSALRPVQGAETSPRRTAARA